MDKIVVWYLRMSVIYFVLGSLLGVTMVIWPHEAGYYSSSHVHLNLLGFMAMMIYGVGYHILPRFSGRHVYSPGIIKVQFWAANAGLAGMVLGWGFVERDMLMPLFQPVLITAVICSFVAAVLFAINILLTIKPA